MKTDKELVEHHWLSGLADLTDEERMRLWKMLMNKIYIEKLWSKNE